VLVLEAKVPDAFELVDELALVTSGIRRQFVTLCGFMLATRVVYVLGVGTNIVTVPSLDISVWMSPGGSRTTIPARATQSFSA